MRALERGLYLARASKLIHPLRLLEGAPVGVEVVLEDVEHLVGQIGRSAPAQPVQRAIDDALGLGNLGYLAILAHRLLAWLGHDLLALLVGLQDGVGVLARPDLRDDGDERIA